MEQCERAVHLERVDRREGVVGLRNGAVGVSGELEVTRSGEFEHCIEEGVLLGSRSAELARVVALNGGGQGVHAKLENAQGKRGAPGCGLSNRACQLLHEGGETDLGTDHLERRSEGTLPVDESVPLCVARQPKHLKRRPRHGVVPHVLCAYLQLLKMAGLAIAQESRVADRRKPADRGSAQIEMLRRATAFEG